MDGVRNMLQSANFDVRLSNGKLVQVLMTYKNHIWPRYAGGVYPFDNKGFVLWAEQHRGFVDNQGNFYYPSEIIGARMTGRLPNRL